MKSSLCRSGEIAVLIIRTIFVSQQARMRKQMFLRKLTSRVISSSTILFCLGTRPAFEPEEMHRAPVSVIEFPPTVGSGERICSGNIAYSYNSATL